MARWAIGDVQGCDAELGALLTKIRFNADRDQLWFCGDLVNRGPDSLGVLRRVRALGANAMTVLGNHDLHLLAIALGADRKLKKRDTLQPILDAPDRAQLIDWLLGQPLVHYDHARRDLLVHAGLLPQWSPTQARALSTEIEGLLRTEPRKLFERMYGDEPDRWRDSLQGWDRARLIINVCTRMRACTSEGRIDLKVKDSPSEIALPLMPWFEADDAERRGTRVIFGHWSTLGFYRGNGVLALDTGCVWGGSLTAFDLDDPEAQPQGIKAFGAVPLEGD